LRTISKGGPFSDATAVVTLDSLVEARTGSMYDYHGKDCPRCLRSLKRAALIERRARQATRILLAGSLILALTAASFGKTLKIPLVGFFIALVCQWVEFLMRQAKETMHHKMDTDPIEDVYAF
jgi:hypothetical protein